MRKTSLLCDTAPEKSKWGHQGKIFASEEEKAKACLFVLIFRFIEGLIPSTIIQGLIWTNGEKLDPCSSVHFLALRPIL